MRPSRTLLLAAAGAGAIAALVPASADAGTYRAVQCHPRGGGGHADAVYRSNSARYARSADCGARGLEVTHVAGSTRTRKGRYGAWSLTAPAGTELVGAKALVSAASQNSHRPGMSVGLDGRNDVALRRVPGDLHAVRWTGTGGRSLAGELACSRGRGCGPGREARFRMRRISLKLRDDDAPAVELGGSMLASGSRRGQQTLDVATNDTGSGVRQVTVEVNGTPIAVRTMDCSVTRRLATRLQPCPASPSPQFNLDTRTAGFRQGPNQIRVCVADYAPRGRGNRECESDSVRIDNLCPVGTAPGSGLRARFERGGARLTTSSRKPAIVAGSVVDDSGSPVRGAEVCLAARVEGHGRRERVIATPITAPDGSFKAKLPAGPNRAVRVAYWPDRERALESMLALRSRVVPRLRIQPKRSFRNGSTARFRVGLPAPTRARRKVAIEARASGRWIRIDSGQTGRRGKWAGRYRFRATTGTRRYAFRAVVPKQRGYPYERGHSRIRRLTVTGG